MITFDPKTQMHTSARPATLLSALDKKFLIATLCALLGIRICLMVWLPFTDTTEARYAEIARKMIETGDWITPQFDYGIPFWGKPPLHTWLSAAGMKIFGVGEVAARIFIFLSGLTVLALTGAFMRRHKGGDDATVVIVVLFSSVLFFGASAFVMTDMVMTLGTTLSMIAFFNHANDQSKGQGWGYLFFVGLAIGLLAKGPVASVLTIMPISLWVLIGRRFQHLRTLPWLSGTALLLLMTLPWYVAAEIKTPGFLAYFIVGEHFERFLVSGWTGDLYGSGHARPKGLIWLYWMGAMLPWSLFAGWLLLRLGSVVTVIRQDQRGWHSYLLLWSIAPMLLFTPAANILAAYVLPGLPAASLLLVSLWMSVEDFPRKSSKIVFAFSAGVITAIFLVITALTHVAPDRLNLKSQKALVAQAVGTDPQIALTYWRKRSYSAEFYTFGKATVTTKEADLKNLRFNDLRDAIAVAPKALEEVKAILGDGYDVVGKIGRDILILETRLLGEKP